MIDAIIFDEMYRATFIHKNIAHKYTISTTYHSTTVWYMLVGVDIADESTKSAFILVNALSSSLDDEQSEILDYLLRCSYKNMSLTILNNVKAEISSKALQIAKAHHKALTTDRDYWQHKLEQAKAAAKPELRLV